MCIGLGKFRGGNSGLGLRNAETRIGSRPIADSEVYGFQFESTIGAVFTSGGNRYRWVCDLSFMGGGTKIARVEIDMDFSYFVGSWGSQMQSESPTP